MDIEQTAFESRQHVFLVRLELALPDEDEAINAISDFRSLDQLSIEMEIAFKMHLRYPLPHKSGRPLFSTSCHPLVNTSSCCKRIVFPAPTVFDMDIQVHQQRYTEFQLMGGDQFVSTFVSAGYFDDYWLAVMTTLAVTIIGSTVLFREICRLSRWL
jgi:hypothetical protein